MKNKLLVTLIFASSWLYAGAQWLQLHPRPAGWTATSLCVPGANRVYAVAGMSILISENIGATWDAVNITDGSPFLNDISFGNPLQGAACSIDGKVYVTADGGQTWTMKQLTTSADLYSVAILPSGVGFVGGDNGKLFKTTDFGENWTSVSETFDHDDIAGIFILDDNNVFLYDDWDAFYYTNDGGQTWSASEFSDINLAHSMHFFDANTGLVGDDYGNLLKTSNGGQSWQKIFDDGETAFNSMSFLNENRGIVGSYDKFMITDDAGQNWTEIDMTGYGSIYAVEWESELLIYASCEMGYIIRTMDGGLTWEKVTPEPAFKGSIKAMAWYDENTILAFTAFPTEIIKSTNRGYSWEKLAAPADGYFRYHTAFSIPGEVLYITTVEGDIFKTTNGGESWQRIETGITEPAGDIHFLTADTGFYSANNGTINRTTNGGGTWTTVSSGTSNIFRISFFDDYLGLAVGANGTILRTTDAGINWVDISNDNTKPFLDVYFVDQDLVFAVGESGRIFRSQDAGLTWSQIPTTTTNNLISIVFLTPEVGYATTNRFGQTVKTVDGGETWEVGSYLAPAYSKAIETPDGSILVYGDYAHISILPNENTWNEPSASVALEASDVGETSFIAHWQPVEGARAYYLMVSDDDFQTFLPGYIPKYCEQTSAVVEGIQPDKTYHYKVIATNETGNSAYSNTISVHTLQTGVTAFTYTDILIYPNPASNYFTIALNDGYTSGMVCNIYDFTGRLLKVISIEGIRSKVDISDLAPALYFARIVKGNQEISTFKIIKN